jgi:PAS domain S-box-containing protein
MPPEQLLEAEKADARSDIWALGATLFELLTGEPPFHAPSMPQLYAAIAHGRIRRTTDLVAETPRWLDAIVSKCLSRRPDDRFENAATLRHALDDGFIQSAVETLPDLRIPRPVSTARPRADDAVGRGLPSMDADASVYRTLLESTRAIPWKLEWQSMRFTYIGPQIEALLGWPGESWKTVEDWADRIHPEDRQRVVEFCVAQSKAGVDHEAEYRAVTKSGRYVWLRDVVHVRRDEEGHVESLVGFMFDITDRKQNEQQMVLRQLVPMEGASD